MVWDYKFLRIGSFCILYLIAYQKAGMLAQQQLLLKWAAARGRLHFNVYVLHNKYKYVHHVCNGEDLSISEWTELASDKSKSLHGFKKSQLLRKKYVIKAEVALRNRCDVICSMLCCWESCINFVMLRPG